MVELQITWNIADKSKNKGGLMVIFSKLDAVLRKIPQENGRKRKASHMNDSEIILIKYQTYIKLCGNNHSKPLSFKSRWYWKCPKPYRLKKP